MVTIIDYKKAQNSAGKEFILLILMGGISFVKSTITGSFYATAWKTSITSTFSEEVCKSLVGTKVAGEIQKIESEPYEYKIKETGETIMLTHKYSFNPSPNTPSMEETVFQPEMMNA
jgi:hypothetical protein